MKIRSLKCERGEQAKLLADIRAGRAVYVGRAHAGLGLAASPLANPFTVAKYGKGSAAPLYRQWLWAELCKAENEKLVDALDALSEDSTLVCWCCDRENGDGDLRCHAQVIERCWKWLQQQRS